MDEEREAATKRKIYGPEQIIGKLMETEVLLSQGQTVGAVSRKLEVTGQTYYRSRLEYYGMQVEQARRLKELERENVRLKKLAADLSLDTSVLKEAEKGNRLDYPCQYYCRMVVWVGHRAGDAINC
jgi:putative transposase